MCGCRNVRNWSFPCLECWIIIRWGCSMLESGMKNEDLKFEWNALWCWFSVWLPPEVTSYGISVAALAFPSSRWLDTGAELLEYEIPHQSNEGGENHPHTDHHPLFRPNCRSHLEVVAVEKIFHQSLFHLRCTCMTDRMQLKVMPVMCRLEQTNTGRFFSWGCILGLYFQE